LNYTRSELEDSVTLWNSAKKLWDLSLETSCSVGILCRTGLYVCLSRRLPQGADGTVFRECAPRTLFWAHGKGRNEAI